MRKSSVLLGAISLACALSAAGSWWQLRAERERVAALEQQLAAVQVHPPAGAGSPAEAGPTTVSAAPPRAAETLASATPPVAAAAATKMDAEDQQDPMLKERRMLANPRYREARKAEMRLQYASWREDAIHVVGMTPQQADQVLDIMFDNQLDWSARANPANAEEYARNRAWGEEQERLQDARYRAILGDTKAAQWGQYIDSLQSRAEVRQLRLTLSSTPEPLRDDQFEQQVAALHAERAPIERELTEISRSIDWWDEATQKTAGPEFAKRSQEARALARDRSRDAAVGLLSTQQLAAFDALRARQLEMEQTRERMLRMRQDLASGAVAEKN